MFTERRKLIEALRDAVQALRNHGLFMDEVLLYAAYPWYHKNED